MLLKVLLPIRVLLKQEVTKVIAEAENGSFCLLPRHIDFIAALVPGILCYVDRQGRERFVGVDEGILVKNGDQVLVSVMNAVTGDELVSLRDFVEQSFMQLDEHERMTRTALARLEAGAYRRLGELLEFTSVHE